MLIAAGATESMPGVGTVTKPYNFRERNFVDRGGFDSRGAELRFDAAAAQVVQLFDKCEKPRKYIRDLPFESRLPPIWFARAKVLLCVGIHTHHSIRNLPKLLHKMKS